MSKEAYIGYIEKHLHLQNPELKSEIDVTVYDKINQLATI
ncbi:hypothetical protein B5X24_HaOG200894, partial [Helicoverpa armigera]